MAQLKDTVVSGDLRITDNISYGNVIYPTVATGTGTAAQDKGSGVSPRYFPAKWTYNMDLSLNNGMVVTIKVPVAGHSYGVYVSIDNGTTYKPVTNGGTMRLTTHFPVNSVISLMYDSSASCSSIYALNGGDATTTITGGAWRVVTNSDNNTTYSAMSSSEMTTGTATSSRAMTATNLKAGLQGILKASNGDVQLYGSHLTGQVPAPTAANNGKILKIVSGAYALTDEAKELPDVTSSDNGKVLRVIDGAWAATSLPSANGANF